MERIRIYEQLLEAGILNVSVRDESGKTTLDHALDFLLRYYFYYFYNDDMRSYLYKVKLLIEHGADLNVCDAQGWTIMHKCVWAGNLTLLQFCVQHGGKINTTDNAGQKPVDLAFQMNRTHLVRYLESQSCDLSQLCRMTIREAMGKNVSKNIHKLPLPKSLKLFINYGMPYSTE